MSFTYSGDPRHNDKDMVRFLIGDTDEDTQLHSDEEINAWLELVSDPHDAAWRLAEAAAAAAAKAVDSKSGQVDVSLSQRHAQLLATAKRLRAQSALRANTPTIM